MSDLNETAFEDLLERGGAEVQDPLISLLYKTAWATQVQSNAPDSYIPPVRSREELQAYYEDEWQPWEKIQLDARSMSVADMPQILDRFSEVRQVIVSHFAAHHERHVVDADACDRTFRGWAFFTRKVLAMVQWTLFLRLRVALRLARKGDLSDWDNGTVGRIGALLQALSEDPEWQHLCPSTTRSLYLVADLVRQGQYEDLETFFPRFLAQLGDIESDLYTHVLLFCNAFAYAGE